MARGRRQFARAATAVVDDTFERFDPSSAPPTLEPHRVPLEASLSSR